MRDGQDQEAVMPDPFYRSRAWAVLRAKKLRLSPNCEWCRARGPRGMHVDHIEPLRRRPDLALDVTNLQTLDLGAEMDGVY